jgi:hypothetical protein
MSESIFTVLTLFRLARSVQWANRTFLFTFLYKQKIRAYIYMSYRKKEGFHSDSDFDLKAIRTSPLFVFELENIGTKKEQ